jgi:hypothetical protein
MDYLIRPGVTVALAGVPIANALNVAPDVTTSSGHHASRQAS